MITNEITFHKRPNDTEINKYRSMYGLEHSAQPIPHRQLKKCKFLHIS